MLIGIIKNHNNNRNYYVHLTEEDNINKLSIVETTKDKVEALDINDAKVLLKTLLSSKLTYKEKYNDYDVYLDEANNKRYFKNGIENYFMFLENNGVSAIKCFNKSSKTKPSTVKAYRIVTSTIAFTIIMSTLTLIPVADDTRFFKGTERMLSNMVPLSATEATNLVNTSFYLSREEKNHLANENYFEFVLNYVNTKDREYYLRNSLNNLRIKHYDYDFFPSASGYYNPLDINAVNICKTVDPNSSEYIDVLSHEFVHATQDVNDYLYLIEATAEMMEYEFYGQPCDGYPELVKRTKVLMEIIGPDPVASCVYSGDTTYFEDTVKAYLSEEDANRLLYLLKTGAGELYESEEAMAKVNIEIDDLLAKMYTNKTGNNINDDLMIRHIYAHETTDRVYFNKKSEFYHQNYYLKSDRVDIDKLNLEDIINSDKVESYTYLVGTERESDGRTVMYYSTITTNDFNSIVPINQQALNIDFKDGTKGITYYIEETNSWEPIQHYKFVESYEPSIPRKFQGQLNTPIKDAPIKEECEAKSI